MRAAAALLLIAVAAGCADGSASRKTAPLEPAIPSPIARDHRAPFEERVRTIYNFKPSRTSSKDQDLKSAEMDALWASVDKAPKTYLPLLRKELKKEEQNPFFRYDGAQLLLKHSQSSEDLQLAADSIGRTDLEDISPNVYFRSTHLLATQGANVCSCVDKILSDNRFKVFILVLINIPEF